MGLLECVRCNKWIRIDDLIINNHLEFDDKQNPWIVTDFDCPLCKSVIEHNVYDHSKSHLEV